MRLCVHVVSACGPVKITGVESRDVELLFSVVRENGNRDKETIGKLDIESEGLMTRE